MALKLKYTGLQITEKLKVNEYEYELKINLLRCMEV
jgi:hypothetical protein